MLDEQDNMVCKSDRVGYSIHQEAEIDLVFLSSKTGIDVLTEEVDRIAGGSKEPLCYQ